MKSEFDNVRVRCWGRSSHVPISDGLRERGGRGTQQGTALELTAIQHDHRVAQRWCVARRNGQAAVGKCHEGGEDAFGVFFRHIPESALGRQGLDELRATDTISVRADGDENEVERCRRSFEVQGDLSILGSGEIVQADTHSFLDGLRTICGQVRAKLRRELEKFVRRPWHGRSAIDAAVSYTRLAAPADIREKSLADGAALLRAGEPSRSFADKHRCILIASGTLARRWRQHQMWVRGVCG